MKWLGAKTEPIRTARTCVPIRGVETGVHLEVETGDHPQMKGGGRKRADSCEK